MIYNAKSSAIGYVGWKYYNTIKDKAMEREFSWSGLFISFFIAFFIVFVTAQGLNIMQQSIVKAQNHERFLNEKVYRLESAKHLNPQAEANLHKILIINQNQKTNTIA